MMHRNHQLLAVLALCLATSAQAQNADCPHLDAAIPRKPPGAPPPFPPPMRPPAKTLAEQLAMPPPQSRELSRDDLPAESRSEWDRRLEEERRNDWIMDAEEGFIASVGWDAGAAARSPLPAALSKFAVPVEKLPLAGWDYLGFRETGPVHVHRYFRGPDRSLLEIDEWDYKTAGGAVFALPGSTNIDIAGRPARLMGLRAPSGCVASSLFWFDDRVSYALRIVGPLDIARQRRQLQEIATAMAVRSQ